MSTPKDARPARVLKQVEKADDSILFNSLISSFFHLFSSLLSALSFLCLFLSFLFSSLFSSLSTLSVLFFSSLSLVPQLTPEMGKLGPGGEAPPKAQKASEKKEGDKGAEKKEGDKGAEKKEGEKGPEKKEGDPGAEKKEGDKGAEKKEPEKKEPEKPKETLVEMKVPICEACTERVMFPLYNMAGVKSVECDVYREKVTVVATTAAPADILIECVKVFSKSRMWRDGD